MPQGAQLTAADGPARRGGRSLLLAAALAWVLLLSLGASEASAGLGWLGPGVGEFPHALSEVELESSPKGLAVNNATGDVYEADGGKGRVLRFDAEGHFLEGWGLGAGNGERKPERCGPDGEPAFPTCAGQVFEGEDEWQLISAAPIAVDQATGNVFVASRQRKTRVVQEYTAEGVPLAAFGEKGAEEKEDQIGIIPEFGGLAVDGAGNVFLVSMFLGQPARVLEFEQISPTEHVFARELLKGQVRFAGFLGIDQTGAFILANGEDISKFAPGNLTTPQWTLPVTEAEGVTVDAESGRVYYYGAKENKYHVVSPSGVDEGTFEGAAGQRLGGAAVFAPTTSFGGRPPGVLYADEGFEGVTKRPSRGLIFAGSATNPPVVGGERVTAVGATFGTIAAEVNPKSFATTYRFEYGSQGPCGSSPCAGAPPAGASAGSGGAPVAVSTALSGLAPGTTYHFRVVAENQFGTVDGADASFTTFPAPTGSLPDHRAYELVSPPEKHGGEVFPLDAVIASCIACEPGRNATKMPEEAAADGESVIYEGLPFQPSPEGATGAVNENEYLSRRTGAGWATSFITPSRLSTGAGRGYRAFSRSLTAGIIAQHEPALAPGGLEPPSEELYLQEGAGLRPLVTEPPLNPKTVSLVYLGGTPDLAHVVFQADGALTRETGFAPAAPEANEAEPNLYEWTGTGVRLVNVAPGNSKATAGVVLGSGKLLANGAESAPDYCGAVSADGSRIFWSKLSNGRVYVREAGERTVQIPDPGKFVCASADGSEVLLNNGRVYNLTSEATTDLAHGKGGFLGTLGASETLSEIYFVDTAVLPATTGPGNASPVLGENNLYLYDAVSATTSFVATLSAVDNQPRPADTIEGDWVASPSDRTAQVTPDGRFVAFESRAPLTGANSEPTSGPCRMESGIRRCPDVFEYDAQARTLTCASCNPAGLPPAGESILSLLTPVGSQFPQPRNLTEDGRLFFDSFDALSVEDVRPGIKNVYEYELDGQGTCTNEHGCTVLISSGRSSYDASFFSAGSTGRDVFFTTRQQLLPALDHDEYVDLYDAREGGGFSAESPPECAGEGCRPAPTESPPSPSPGSATFNGPGNLTPRIEVKSGTVVKPPAKCRKAFVRRHGRCVRVRHKKHKRGHRASVDGAARRGGGR